MPTELFPELKPFADAGPRRVAPRDDSWLAEEMRRERDAELRRTIIQAPPPDEVARTTVAAREADVPPMQIEGRLGEVEASRRASAFTDLVSRSSALGRWATANPRGAVAASDDTESLGILGSAWDIAKNLPGRIGGAGGWQLGGMISDTFGMVQELNDLAMTPLWAGMSALSQASGLEFLDPEQALEARARERAESSAAFRGAAARAREVNRGENWVTEGLLAGTESIPLTIGAVLTRNPTAASTVMGTLVGGGSYAEARAKGLDPATALRYGMTQGSIEGATELIPAGTLVDMIARKLPWGKAFVRELGQEMAGEQVATALQDLTDWAFLPENRGKTFGDYLSERPDAALSTALAVAGGTTTTSVGIGAAQRATDATARVGERIRQASQARAERRFVEQAERAAEGSKLRQRDPEAFRDLVRQQAEETGATELFIPGEAIKAYQQSDTYDQRDDPFSRYDVDEAAAAGGDVVIPIADALTDLVGTPAWNAVRDDVRLAPGGMSSKEAATFEEAMDDVMADLSEQSAKAEAEEAGQRTVREAMVDQVATMFGESFTAPVARTIAELAVQRAYARAKALGQGLTGGEFGGFEVRQVMPEGVAEAVKADRLGDVIAAMRDGSAAVVEPVTSPGEPIGVAESGEHTSGFFKFEGPDGVFSWHPEDGIANGAFPKRTGVTEADVRAHLGLEPSVDPMPAAAEDLRAMLEQSGLDPAAMSDAEIRAAVEGMASEEAVGAGRRALYQNSATLTGQNPQSRYMVIHDGSNGQEQGQEADAGDAGEQPVSGGDNSAQGARGQGVPEGQIELFPGVDLGVDPNFYGSTIEVDGVERPTLNANGDLIASTRAAVESFWRWFGDSKMVDREGRPLVFYHGTRADLASIGVQNFAFSVEHTSTFFFAVDRDTAESFANDKEGGVIAAYLAAERVDEYDAEGRSWGEVVPLDSHEVSEAQAQWRADQMEKFEERSELVESGIEATPWRLRNADGTEQWFEGHDEALEALDEAIEREREEFEEGLRDEEPWESELAELGYLEREGYSTDYLAAEAMGQFDAVLIHDVDEGAGATTVAIVLAQPNAIKSTQNAGTFDPSDPRILFQEARGRIVFDQNKRIIELFQSRNLSTPLHELSHMWLEELAADASLPNAPDQLKADWETAKRYFAANGHKIGKDGMIPTEAHELWARTGERYLMEGKAPSSALTRLFETFRAWLVNIYKTVDRLRAPITPEIREVFDRLLATDEEIAAARERQGLEALFKDAAEAGMTKDEFTAYQRQVDDARSDAHSKLLDKAMKSVRHRETRRYQEARRAVRAEEQERIDAAPLYKALAAMKVNRVSREWIVDNMGADALDLLPVRVPPLHTPGGADPNLIAEQSGYAGAQEMIEALIGAEAAHRQAREGGDRRSMRERAIETATDAEMTRRWGDPLNDGSIEREALATVQSDLQGEVIASEIRVLSRKTGQRPTPYQLAREWARGKVRAGTVAQEASPAAIQRHARSAAKAGREAEAAMLKGDAEAAFRFKQQQMLSNALLVSAKEALDEVNAAVRRMDRTARARTRESTDQGYLDQAHALLEAVDLKKRSQAGIDRQGKWAEWAAERQAEGYDVAVPPSFEATIGKTNWSRLSVENLLALDEAVKQILHLGRRMQTVLDQRERRLFDEVVGEAVGGMDGMRKKPPSDMMEPTRWDAVKSRVASIDAALLKMETVFDWLDRGNSNGVFNRVVFRPMAEAQDRARTMMNDLVGQLNEAVEAVPQKTLRRWRDKVRTELLNPETGRPYVFIREQLVSVALNMGNRGNIEKLTGGYGWNEATVREVLNRELTAEEWAYVQKVWDIVGSLWPEIAALEKRINGIEPEKVEATPVETPSGTLPGGYFPVVYDPRRSYQAEAQAASNLFEPAYTRATTPKGFTKARTEVQRPIHLSLNVIGRHVAEVVHDLTHREAVMQADKFLSDRRVMKAVDETLGPQIRRAFRPWLQRIANQWAYDRAGMAGIEGFLNKMRTNATVVGMGFRLSTIMVQAAGYANSFEVVGERWVAPRLKDAANPAAWKFVLEKSKEVAGRMSTLDRDISDAARRAAGKGRLTGAAQFAFYGIGLMDRVVSIPTWLGAYDKALAQGMNEQDAIYAADKAIRQSQGSGSPKDLAAIQAGRGPAGALGKYLTMFYSFMSAFYQRQRTLSRDVRDARPRDVPRLIARAWWLLVAAPLMAELLAGRGPGDDDDDETWASWAVQAIAGQFTGSIPIARDLVPVMVREFKDQPSYGYRFTPAQGGAEALVRLAKNVEKAAEGDETKDATRNVIELVGYSTGSGLATGQIAAAAQFLVDVGYGDADPEGLAEWYEGLTSGKVKQD